MGKKPTTTPGVTVGNGVIIGIVPPEQKHRCDRPKGYENGALWTVWRCNQCGTKWRLEPTGYNLSGTTWNQWDRFDQCARRFVTASTPGCSIL